MCRPICNCDDLELETSPDHITGFPPELALRDGPVRDELELLVGELVALEDVDGLHLVLLPRRQAQVGPAVALLPLQSSLKQIALTLKIDKLRNQRSA